MKTLAPTLAPLLGSGDGAEVRAAMDRIASLGFRFVQLSATQPGLRPRDLDRSARRDLLATLQRRELQVAGLDAWIPPRHLLDPAHSDRAVSALASAIEMAADLGRCSVSFTLPQVEKSEASDPLTAIVDAISAHADRLGVQLADHAVPIIQRDAAVIGIGIDPPAWLSQKENPIDGVLANSGRIVSARLSDLLTSGMRGPIGDSQEGQLDVTAYRVALSVSGYAKPIVIDARQWFDAWSGLEQTAAAWARTAL